MVFCDWDSPCTVGNSCIKLIGIHDICLNNLFWLATFDWRTNSRHPRVMTRNWSSFFLNLILGILNFVGGAIMIAKPEVGALSLTLLLAAFFSAGGLIRIVTALAMRPHQWGWLLLNGIVTLLLGILIGLEWPLSSLWVIGMFVGIDLVLSGWSFIALALEARTILHHGDIANKAT